MIKPSHARELKKLSKFQSNSKRTRVIFENFEIISILCTKDFNPQMIIVEKPQRKSLEKHQSVKRQPAPLKKERPELAIQPVDYLTNKSNSQSVRSLRSPENRANPQSIKSMYVPVVNHQKAAASSPKSTRNQKLLASSNREIKDNINMTLPAALPSQSKPRSNFKSIYGVTL